jgi:hypothetical protein
MLLKAVGGTSRVVKLGKRKGRKSGRALTKTFTVGFLPPPPPFTWFPLRRERERERERGKREKKGKHVRSGKFQHVRAW